MAKRGVLYFVSGDTNIYDECIYSAQTFKKHNPDIPVQVIAEKDYAGFNNTCFDYVDVYEDQTFPLKAKVKYLSHSRFQHTLFLDADTRVNANVSELFEVAEEYDLALTYDNECDWNANPVQFLKQESTEFNTGFLLYNDSPKVKEYLKEWETLVMQQDESVMRPGNFCDQIYFNSYLKPKVLHDSDLKLKILPNNIYNVRPWCWKSLKEKGEFGNVKILHAHGLHLSFTAKVIRKIKSLF